MRRLLALSCLLGLPLAAQSTARIREYRQEMPTYEFGDPNPIPVVGRIYPYFRFDGFSDKAVKKSWKIVELENEYLRILITPEIGGKIWAAIEKKGNRPFIYYNHAVKFRDIAMRGPWTSGGIEINYGIIGHTPNVSTPVEYVTRRNADGSVSCIVGAHDMLTNTDWRVETRLAPGEASFTTTSNWQNGSTLEEPYYHWMTAGIPVQGRLQYVFPGTAQIGHDGEVGEWPINTKRNKDVSWYDNNDFGGYKSYHVLGATNDFFGAYWHDRGLGMARVAPRDEKAGQKIWIWGLSRQGMIWEDLLTDTDGQYSELQSGRLFNQSAEGSTFTPFKHRGFTPQGVDRWTERWMPVVGTEGFVTAGDAGAMNVRQVGDQLIVGISPNVAIDDSLFVMRSAGRFAARRVRATPLHPWTDTIPAKGAALEQFSVQLGVHRLDWSGAPPRDALQRPLTTPANFDWKSAYGLWWQGKELVRQREYIRAAAYLDSAVARDSNFVPALVDRAALLWRSRADWLTTDRLLRRALSIDAYDGAANYYYGLVNEQLSRMALAGGVQQRANDARDGFETATQSLEWRQAAYVGLASHWMYRGNDTRASSYVAKLLQGDDGNVTALAMQAVLARRAATPTAHQKAITALRRADPLNYVAAYEALLAAKRPMPAQTLRKQMRAELPAQELFDLAEWYRQIGDTTAVRDILHALPDQPTALYWLAQLEPAQRSPLITRANALSPRFVFPSRDGELDGAIAATSAPIHAWQPRYYAALAYWGLGRVDTATQWLVALADEPDFAPFYALRASLPDRPIADRIRDLQRAIALDSTEWRFGKLLAERQMEARDFSGAVATGGRYAARFPKSYILGLTQIRTLVAAERFAEADGVLAGLHVLPYEGAAEGHALYRETQLSLAVAAIAKRDWETARRFVAAAREWPERLGAGKPYDADIDDRVERFLLGDIDRRASGSPAAPAAPTVAAGSVDGRVLDRWRKLVP